MTYRMQRPMLMAFIFAAFLAPGGASGAAAAEPTKLTISWPQKVPDFLPVLIAKDAGYFKKHDLDVTVLFVPVQEGIAALLNDQIQVAGISGSDTSAAEAQGARFVVVVTLTPLYPFQFWARPKYASAKALKGQRVGFTSRTGAVYTGTLLALKQLGLTTSDVIMTPLGGVSNVNSALLAGSIAAAASHPPATYEFKRAGFVDLVDLPKRKIPAVSSGIWVTQSFLQKNRDVVQKVVDAILDAIQREKSDRAYAEKEMTKYLGVKNKGELDFTYNFYVDEVLAPGPMPEVTQLEGNIKAMALSNPKVKTIDAASMVDPSFVKNAEKQ